MANIEIDTSEVRALAADMRGVDGRLARHLKPVVAKGALNIKNQLRSEMRESRHFGVVARGITYDLEDGGYSAAIGPEKGSPGSLANIAYFGTSRGGGTVPDPVGALQAESEAFISHLERLAGELTLG